MLKQESLILTQSARNMGLSRWVAQHYKDVYIETDKSLITRMYLKYFGCMDPNKVEFWNKENPYGTACVCDVTKV